MLSVHDAPVMIRYIEIGFVPLVKAAYPSETVFVDTRFSWEDRRGREPATGSILGRLQKIVSDCWQLLDLPSDSEIEGVFVRSRGAENSSMWRPNFALKAAAGHFLHRLAGYLSRKHHCPLVVVDRTDEATIHPNDRWALDRCELYFKREVPLSRWAIFERLLPTGKCVGVISRQPTFASWGKKIHALPLGIEDESVSHDDLAARPKMFDIFYAGSAHGLARRQRVSAAVARLATRGYSISLAHGELSEEEFVQRLKSSRIAVSPGGIGWDCFRHYEITAAGTAMVLEAPCHEMPLVPGHGDAAIWYGPHDDLEALLESWLERPTELAALAERGRCWLSENATHSKLGEYILTMASASAAGLGSK